MCQKEDGMWTKWEWCVWWTAVGKNAGIKAWNLMWKTLNKNQTQPQTEDWLNNRVNTPDELPVGPRSLCGGACCAERTNVPISAGTAKPLLGPFNCNLLLFAFIPFIPLTLTLKFCRYLRSECEMCFDVRTHFFFFSWTLHRHYSQRDSFSPGFRISGCWIRWKQSMCVSFTIFSPSGRSSIWGFFFSLIRKRMRVRSRWLMVVRS